MAHYWQNKRVLVTGADGFIGSHLVQRLLVEGAKIRAFVYYNSFSRWGWLDESEIVAATDLEIFPGDIRDAGRVAEAVKEQEIVFHLASLIAIPYSYHAPESYVQTNVVGALNVLNACKTYGTGRIVHTSTSEVYGSARYVPINEEHPLQGQSPYSASKIGADMMAMSFHQSFALPVITVRPFNTYGPRQSARAVIPTILAQIHHGARELKLGSLTPTRDFSYVADTVSGFLAVAQCDRAFGQIVNVGSGKEISIGDLVKTVIRITGKEVRVVTDESRMRPENSEVNRLLCDATRVREWTGWMPEFSLEQGLVETSKWVANNLQYFKPKLYNI